MPTTNVTINVATAPDLIDDDAVRLAAVKTVNAGATTAHGSRITAKRPVYASYDHRGLPQSYAVLSTNVDVTVIT